jgi:ABC-type Fe3+-hydroxamate transport system substrate-binding protein
MKNLLVLSNRLLKELFWLIPFISVAFVAAATLRTPPVFPAPAQSHMVVDAEGVNVAVPFPFRAIVGYGGSDFLETTRAPETLLKAGSFHDRDFWFASGIMSRIYPQVLKDDNLWNSPPDLESLLAQDIGATYFFGGPLATSMRRIGLAVITRGWRPKNRDEMIFTATRLENAALGDQDRGEAFIAGYQQAFARLEQDLQPQTLTNRPRVLTMGGSARDWSNLYIFGVKASQFDGVDERVGVQNASEGYEASGRQQDVERILAMNPDIIFLLGESAHEFLQDPRWRGLKAVRTNRVYNGLRSLRGSFEPLYGIDFRPLWARWQAEIAHSDRVEPRVRELLRDRFVKAYGYRLSDDEIDNLLRTEENKDSSGYARFTANAGE